MREGPVRVQEITIVIRRNQRRLQVDILGDGEARAGIGFGRDVDLPGFARRTPRQGLRLQFPRGERRGQAHAGDRRAALRLAPIERIVA